MAVKNIGVWRITYPCECNEANPKNVAFVADNWKSDFVYLYGNGKIGMSSGLRGIGNKKVIKYLEKLSSKLDNPIA